MKVRILQKFHDRADFRQVYLVGETFTFDDARAEYLIDLGLVEKLTEEKTQVQESPEPEQPLFAEEKAVKPVTTRRRSAPKENK